jgi:hypothetical protein
LVTEYRRYKLVQYRFVYEGIPIFGWILQSQKENIAWHEKIDQLNFPLDLYIGGGSSIYFSTKESYLKNIIEEDLTWTEAANLKKIFGMSYNWKEPFKVRN